VELPINPITSAIMNGATFVARAFSGDGKQLIELMKKAIEHKGFALLDIFSPCVTFNHDNDYSFFRERIKKLEDEGHDVSDWKSACEKALLWDDTIYTGLFLQKDAPTLGQQEPVLDEDGPLAFRALGLTQEQTERIIKRMM
jgi:2-oxoglutarate ferredoxin oxidoreductase subunit beta